MIEEVVYFKPSYSSMGVFPNDMLDLTISHSSQKYPFCIVWTPIPLLTWIFPFIGHMGIAMSSGIIRDFAASYYVGTGNFAFGKPTRFWQLNPMLAAGNVEGWDLAVTEASEIYKNRNHNLFFDNCHSYVALALKKMNYKNTSSWSMVKLAFLMFIHGKYVNCTAILKSWAPFCILFSVILIIVFCS